MVGSLASMAYAYHRLLALGRLRARVPHLVDVTLARLSAQAAALQSPSAGPAHHVDPWIAVAQLRDDVLRHEHSAAKREALWKRVRNVVERNANVRASVKETRATGEVGRVWEWIGAVPQDLLETAADHRARLSWGSPGHAGDALHMDTKSWDEGRPIY